MKILITGGAGFIGSHIANQYLDAGHEVVIVDDLSSGCRENIPSQAKFYEISIESPEVEDIVAQERPDILNHHAAQIDVRKSVANPVRDAQINILGALNIFEAVRKHGIKKIILASTGGAIYGEQDSFPADELHRTDPLSPYGAAKLAVEKYLYFYQETYGIPFVSLRYANVYGPRQNSYGEAGVVAIFINNLLNSELPTIYGDGKQTRDYVFIEDVVACNLKALEPIVSGIFNVGTGVETDVNELIQELLQLTGTDLSPRYVPTRPGEQRRSCLKPGSLQKLPPIPLSEGLQKTVNWFRI